MISLILLAGGKGERFGGNKCFVSLNGKPVLDYALEVIEPFVHEVVVVAPKPYKHYKHAQPGKTRQESVLNGLKACSDPTYVIVHEAVRPFVTKQIMVDLLMELINGARSVSTAVPVVDGVLFKNTPISKKGYYQSQTPEGFDYRTLLKAHQQACCKSYDGDVQMVYEELGIEPVVVMGVFVNSKITFPNDLPNAEGILKFTQRPIDTTPQLAGQTIAVYGASGTIGGACVRLLQQAGATVLQPKIDEDIGADGVIYAAGAYRADGDIMGVNFEVPLRLLSNPKAKHYVFLSSTAATYGRKEALYSASKAALNSLIESKHEELAQQGVYVNAIAPARVKGRLQAYFTDKPQDDFLEPDYVAECVLKYLDTKEHGNVLYLRNKL